MASLEPDLISLLRLPVAVMLFALPGWLLGRVLGSPFPVLTTFLGSAAIFFNGVLLLDAFRGPLNPTSLGLLIALPCLLLGRRAPHPRPAGPDPEPVAPLLPSGRDWL